MKIMEIQTRIILCTYPFITRNNQDIWLYNIKIQKNGNL